MDISDSNYLHLALGFVSALILFIYAIENLSTEFRELANEKFRDGISHIVKNRYIGTFVGAISTAIIQSSSAITVMTVMLVNTGVVSFRNSLGIIFGSSIGTTITAQLALIDSSIIAPIFIIVGTLLRFSGKKLQVISKPVFFLGFILFTLNILSNNLEPLKNSAEVVFLFSQLSSPLVAYLFAALFTSVVQSSSITTGIIVILAQGGLVGADVAIPMILGANLGSSVTALIASTGLSLYARRAGIATFIFKVIGTLAFMLLLSPFTQLMRYLFDDVAQQVAFSHLIFNLVNTGIFLIFLSPFEKLILKIVKGDEEEILFKTKYIQKEVKKKVLERVVDIKNELAYSIENVTKIYQKALSVFYHNSGSVRMNIQKLETLNDYLDDEITASIVSISKKKLSRKIALETVTLVKVSNTIEQMGDLGEDFSKVFERMHKLGIRQEEIDIENLTNIHNKLIELFKNLELVILDSKEDDLIRLKATEEEIYTSLREQFDLHVQKLQEGGKYDGSVFVDAVSIIELSVAKARDIRKLLLKQVRDSKVL